MGIRFLLVRPMRLELIRSPIRPSNVRVCLFRHGRNIKFCNRNYYNQIPRHCQYQFYYAALFDAIVISAVEKMAPGHFFDTLIYSLSYYIATPCRVFAAAQERKEFYMSARINYANRDFPNRPSAAPAEDTGRTCGEPIAASANTPAGCGCSSENDSACGCGCESCTPCSRSVNFCETITLHESFDASDVCSSTAKIAYDTSFLGYTVEEMTMSAQLPCGGCCPVQVYRISLTGAIPYIINVGSVKSGCGSSVCLSVSGSTMVDEVVGYACGGSEPDLTELSCGSVTPSVNVSTEQCGCSGKTNVTVYGCFEFSNLPSLM